MLKIRKISAEQNKNQSYRLFCHENSKYMSVFFLVRVLLMPAPSLDKCARETGHDTFGGAEVYRFPSCILPRWIKSSSRKGPPYAG